MFKYLLAASLVLSTVAQAEPAPKYLSYQFSRNVIIHISNIECSYKELKKTHPHAAMAVRYDGQVLTGCFKKKDDNNIEISWYLGDTTVLPANAFLIQSEVPPSFAPKTDI